MGSSSKKSSGKKDLRLYARLLHYVLPYWRVFLLTIISMIVLAATAPAIPALMQPMLDGAFLNKDEKMIILIPFLFAGVFIIRGLATYVSSVSLSWISQKAIMELRKEMFIRLLAFPSRYFDHNTSGKLMSRFTFDVTQVSEASSKALAILLPEGLTIIGLVAWMLYIDWLLTLICLVFTPCIALIILIIKRRLRKMSQMIQDTMGDMHHILRECFDAHKVIKLYGGEQLETERFTGTIGAHRKFAMKFTMAAAASAPVIQIVAAIILAIVIYIATQQAKADLLTVGEFVSFFSAMALLLSPIKRLAGVNEYIQKGLAACESVFDLLDSERETDTGTRRLDHVKGVIHFQQVSYRYPSANKPALESVSIKIDPGETVALVGESGSGKTTLAHLLPRFYEADRGIITLDDIDIKEIDLKSLRQNIAYVSQNIILFNETVKNNIVYGLNNTAEEDRLWRIADAAYASEFIKALPEGMDTVIGESGTRLSGGQRQRLAIARALLKNAPILILDEATSSLDARSEKHIQSAMENIKHGRTCIIIAHRLSTIESADRIIVLDRGRIAETGTHDALLEKQGIYSRLYQMQLGNNRNVAVDTI